MRDAPLPPEEKKALITKLFREELDRVPLLIPPIWSICESNAVWVENPKFYVELYANGRGLRIECNLLPHPPHDPLSCFWTVYHIVGGRPSQMRLKGETFHQYRKGQLSRMLEDWIQQK